MTGSLFSTAKVKLFRVPYKSIKFITLERDAVLKVAKNNKERLRNANYPWYTYTSLRYMI